MSSDVPVSVPEVRTAGVLVEIFPAGALGTVRLVIRNVGPTQLDAVESLAVLRAACNKLVNGT